MTADRDDGVVVVGGGPCAAVAARNWWPRGSTSRCWTPDEGRRAACSSTSPAARRCAGRSVATCSPIATARAGHQPVTWISSLSLGGLTNFWTGVVPRFAPDGLHRRGSDRRALRLADRLRRPRRVLRPRRGRPHDHRWRRGDTERPARPGRPIDYRPPRDWVELADVSSDHGATIAAGPDRQGIAVDDRPSAARVHQPRTASFGRFAECAELPPASATPGCLRLVHLELLGSRRVGHATSMLTRPAARPIAARAFVLAAGTLDTTEILLRSVSSDFPRRARQRPRRARPLPSRPSAGMVAGASAAVR